MTKAKFTEALKWTESIIQEKSEYVNIEEKISNADVEKRADGKRVWTEEEKKELRRKQQEKALEVFFSFVFVCFLF
jgi:hypothetical protein